MESRAFENLNKRFLTSILSEGEEINILNDSQKNELSGIINEIRSLNSTIYSSYSKTRLDELLTDIHRLFKNEPVEIRFYRDIGEIYEEQSLSPRDTELMIAIEYANNQEETDPEIPQLMIAHEILENYIFHHPEK